jgi:hypothetical protein
MNCPSYSNRTTLSRAEGAGKTGYQLIPAVRVQQKSTRQNHRLSPISGLPCANGLRLIRDLPRDRLSCPCLCTTLAHRHGISTGMPEPHDFTVLSVLFVRARHSVLQYRQAIASHLACRDGRDTPLLPRRDVRKDRPDLPDETSVHACDKVTRQAICAWWACGTPSVVVPGARSASPESITTTVNGDKSWGSISRHKQDSWVWIPRWRLCRAPE